MDVLQQKNTALYQKSEEIKAEAKEILKTIPTVFRQFTDHSIDHKSQVLSNYEIFLTRPIIEALDPFEIYFLICATYLHDIGMSLLHNLGDIQSESMDSKETEQYLRNHHHIRTEKYIRKFHTNLGIKKFHQARIIGNICKGHRKEDLSNRQDFKKEDGYDGRTINIAFLSLCLKIADELDITHSRTPKSLFEILDISDKTSKDEWIKHLSISSVQRSIENKENIICLGETDSPNVLRNIKIIEKKIDQLLKTIPSMLDARLTAYEEEIPRNFLIDITPLGFIPKDLKFSLANDQIIEILYHNLYRYREESLRELLKNSVDSVERARKDFPTNNPIVQFNLSADKKILEIVDNGAGMNELDIENFFTKIGSSYYQSEEFKNQYSFNPLSEHGIGFLSVFMIAKHVEIDTHKMDSDPLCVEIENKLDFFIIRKGKMKSLGTIIFLHLNNEMQNDKKIENVLRYYSAHLNIPIQFNFDERLVTIKDKGYFPSRRSINKDKYFHIFLDEYNIRGVIFFAIEKDEERVVLLNRYSDKVREITNRYYRSISFKGIRINDNTILPSHFDYLYLDINFKDPLLKLNAASNSFIVNEKLIEYKSKIDSIIVSSFKEILNKFVNLDKKMRYQYAQLVFSHYVVLFNIGKHALEGEDIDIIKDFFLDYDLFISCINGKFEYANPRKLIEETCVIVKYNREPAEYIEELIVNSTAFSKDKNYVFIKSHFIHWDTEFEKKEEQSYDILSDTFGKVVTEIEDHIKFENIGHFSDLSLLPDYWDLIKFTNYNSKKLIEEFKSGTVLVNSDHRFIKLLLKNLDYIRNNEELKDKVQLFFNAFPRVRYAERTQSLLPFQLGILNWMRNNNIIDNIDYYKISEEDTVSSDSMDLDI